MGANSPSLLITAMRLAYAVLHRVVRRAAVACPTTPMIKNIPLAFVTGYDKVTAPHYAGVPILQKPFSDEELGPSDIRLAHETASKIS